MKANAKIPCYCIRLRRITHAVTQFYDTALSASGLTVNQYSLLANLKWLGTSSMTDLAAQVGLDRSTVVRNLRPLFNLGYVEDSSSPETRNKAIFVTQSGSAVLETARPLWERAQRNLTAIAGKEKLNELFDALAGIETPG